MNKKFLLAFIVALVLNVSSINALSYNGCEYSTIARIKSLVNNINLTYDYRIEGNNVYFDVTITNMFPDAYFTDSATGKKYYYSDTNNGEITIKGYSISSGRYKFYTNLSGCPNTVLGSRYYSFPSYNYYYNSELCTDVPEFNLCKKWLTVNYSEQEFKKLVEEYKEGLNGKGNQEEEIIKYDKSIFDKLAEIYVNYYYYFLASIIIICGAAMIITRQKNRFKL